MNKKVLSKLKMEKPSYFDYTESEAVIIQKSEIKEIIKNVFKKGVQIGSVLGVFSTAISSLLALLTVPQFNSFLNIEGSTWRAIFILIFVISFIAFFVLLIPIVLSHIRGFIKKTGSWESEIIKKLFDKNKKINI